MFDQLFPREMQELLWEKRDDFKSVQVFSREPFIPWELVYLKDPRKRVAERGNKFLGELGLLRWLYDGFPPSKLRIRRSRVRYLISDVTGDNMELPEAEAEGGLLRKKLGGTAVNPDLEDLSPLLQKPGSFDLLHICCHGHAAGKDSAQAQLYITGIFEDGRFMGQTLQATTVQQTASLAEPDAEHRPIVVVNACESGRPNREFNGMGGFAHAFVRARAGAFIGTHWSVGDAPALAFVEALYDSFLGKKRKKPVTLSAAVIKAREKARANQDATWLAYVVYGHPHAEVTVE
jgi:hypothetical protein